MIERREDYQNLNGIKDDIQEIKADVKTLMRAIHGNGEPGIKTRLDRVERSIATVSKVIWLVVSLFITGIITKVLGFWQ